jgi:intein-encoded DNA endonuclease-like protein
MGNTTTCFNLVLYSEIEFLKNFSYIGKMNKIELDSSLVVKKYYELMNIYKVGDFFGVSSTFISKILKNSGIILQNRRYFVNETYFDIIDSEDKAYWLGFLFADGYIRERKNGDSLEIKLSQLDIEHLELLKKCMDSTHNIKLGISKTKNKKGKEYTSHMATLSMYSNRLVESIKKQGFHSRKTFTIEKPNLKEEYYRHFIRGFFDGDGCCYIQERNNGVIHAQYNIACASPNFKQFIIDELNKYSIDSKCGTSLTIDISRYPSIVKFFNYLYDDSTIYLKRKKDKGDKFIEYFNKKKELGAYSFQDNFVHVERDWLEEDINIVKEYVNKIPLMYLSFSILPNKTKHQISRLCRKLNIKNDKRMSKKDYEEYCMNNNIQPYFKIVPNPPKL